MTRLFILCFGLSCCLPFKIKAQQEGDQWVFGYWSNGNPAYSIIRFDFREGEFQLDWMPELVFRFNETQSNLCDQNGIPLLWTNGMQIMGRGGEPVLDTIAYVGNVTPGYWENYFWSGLPAGFPKHDGALILPLPGSQNEFSVLYHSAEYHPTRGFQISKYMEARIAYNKDSTFTAFYKDSIMGAHHLWYAGPIKAVRHANGRDWWVVTLETDSPRYYAYLLNPSGIRLFHEGLVDVPIEDGLGQAAFSNQGNYLARMDELSIEEGQYITLYSFDRCNGELNRVETFHTDAGFFTGVAFSPSEQYLYADDNTHLWQWDLWAEDISASQTLVDTFDGFIQPGWFEMDFGPLIAAPNGRIYVVPPKGSSEFMHVIDRPDLPAAECRFLQHHINLTVPNGRSAPNIPNFRLGPLDGSPCDTLGLDNHPVARWRYEEDQPGYWQTIRFTDLSFYDPEIWHWDFNDGTTSDEVSPVHTFEPGLYHICLTVSNSFATDSACRLVEILTTSLDESQANQTPDLSISPNPFQDALVIWSVSGVIRTAHMQLYDIHGKIVFDQQQTPVPVSIQLPSLLPGMYLCRIEERDGTVSTFKVMKQ